VEPQPAPAFSSPATSPMVESRSITRRAGSVMALQARLSTSSEHRFELADMTETERLKKRPERRGCHHPARKNLLGLHRHATGWRGRWWATPATMACTRVSTLCPGAKPPSLEGMCTMASTSASRSRRFTNEATSTSLALATRPESSKLTAMRSMPRERSLSRSASSVARRTVRSSPAFSQVRRHFWRIGAGSAHGLGRCIEALKT